nr:hypothetical protein OG409_00330 [Streptomyces sp. NBC_00974]WSX54295.1 hypothetical protein OG409_38580 [Streptomyces sp. NBC_00974]
MGTSETGAESMGEEPRREPAAGAEGAPPAQTAPRSRSTSRALAWSAVRAVIPAVVEVVVARWAPEWSGLAGDLLDALEAARALRGFQGRPRGGRRG